jgi:hypothetical protein
MVVAKFNKHQASHKHANSLCLNAFKNYQDNNDVLNVGGAPESQWEAIASPKEN